MGYCFVDKNKDGWRFLAGNMDSLTYGIKGYIGHENSKHFHEILTGYADICTNNINDAKDSTYNICGLI